MTVIIDGYHGDTSRMWIVGGEEAAAAESLLLFETTHRAMWAGIKARRPTPTNANQHRPTPTDAGNAPTDTKRSASDGIATDQAIKPGATLLEIGAAIEAVTEPAGFTLVQVGSARQSSALLWDIPVLLFCWHPLCVPVGTPTRGGSRDGAGRVCARTGDDDDDDDDD